MYLHAYVYINSHRISNLYLEKYQKESTCIHLHIRMHTHIPRSTCANMAASLVSYKPLTCNILIKALVCVLLCMHIHVYLYASVWHSHNVCLLEAIVVLEVLQTPSHTHTSVCADTIAHMLKMVVLRFFRDHCTHMVSMPYLFIIYRWRQVFRICV